MTFHLYEDTWETSTTTGTGDYVLGGAASGWRPFSAQYVDTNTTWYSAFDGINFEHGIGTYNSGPNTLSRTTVLRSTNGGNPVVWTSGVRHIVCAPLGAMLEKLNPPISAQMLDIDPLRLTAVGTKLKALGPTTVYNGPTAALNTAVDGAINQNNGSVNHTWGLQAATPGACLSIQLTDSTHTCTIVPAPGDVIVSPSGAFTNASPMVIPAMPRGANAHLFLIGRAGGWDLLSINPRSPRRWDGCRGLISKDRSAAAHLDFLRIPGQKMR